MDSFININSYFYYLQIVTTKIIKLQISKHVHIHFILYSVNKTKDLYKVVLKLLKLQHRYKIALYRSGNRNIGIEECNLLFEVLKVKIVLTLEQRFSNFLCQSFPSLILFSPRMGKQFFRNIFIYMQ